MNMQILSEQSEGICFVLSLSVLIKYDILRTWEKPESQAAYPLFRRGWPSRYRKEGVANVCYICGLDPNWNIHCNPYRAVLHSLQGKTKIAAITRNNDGCLWNNQLVLRVSCYSGSLFIMKRTLFQGLCKKLNYIVDLQSTCSNFRAHCVILTVVNKRWL